MLDAVCSCVQHWTQVIAASNTYSWLNPVFKRRFCFGRRFSHFIASDTCLDTRACCRSLVSRFCALHRSLSRGFPRLFSFPFACHILASCGFYSVYRIRLLSPLLVLRSHRVVLFGFSALVFLSPLHVALHCMVLSVFCFIAYICIRAVMLTVWSSHEPGFAWFGT